MTTHKIHNKKVFIVNKGSHDYSDAKRFGDIIFLSEGPMNPHKIGEMYRHFAVGLSESKPNDYLILAGLAQMSAIAASILSYMHGRVNFLIFNMSLGKYIKKDMVLANLVDIIVHQTGTREDA